MLILTLGEIHFGGTANFAGKLVLRLARSRLSLTTQYFFLTLRSASFLVITGPCMRFVGRLPRFQQVVHAEAGAVLPFLAVLVRAAESQVVGRLALPLGD